MSSTESTELETVDFLKFYKDALHKLMFQLPDKLERKDFGGGSDGDLDLLKRKNPNVFDSNVEFDASTDPRTGDTRHDYWYLDAVCEWKLKGSCTGLIGKYKSKEFLGAGVIYDKNTRPGGAFLREDNAHYGKTREQFIDWCNAQSHHGTRMHLEIERFLNNCVDMSTAEWTTDPNVEPSLRRFVEFWKAEFVNKIYAWRTEQNIFLTDCIFAGQADLIFRRIEWDCDPMMEFFLGIGDWKRSNKDLESLVAFGNAHMLGVCEKLPDVAHSHYCLQMTLYALVFMMRTKYTVVELRVGQFHEKNTSYVWKEFSPLFDVAKQMLLERRALLLHEQSTGVQRRLFDMYEDLARQACGARYDAEPCARYGRPALLQDEADAGNAQARMALQMRDLTTDVSSLAAMVKSEAVFGSSDIQNSVLAHKIDAAIAKYNNAMEYVHTKKKLRSLLSSAIELCSQDADDMSDIDTEIAECKRALDNIRGKEKKRKRAV